MAFNSDSAHILLDLFHLSYPIEYYKDFSVVAGSIQPVDCRKISIIHVYC